MNTEIAYLESLAIGRPHPNQPSDALLAAIARRDRRALTEMLGARHNLVCAIFPVDPDRQDDDQQQDDKDDEKEAPQQRAA